MPYAEGTSVSVERSKAELDTLLSKHGATARGIMSDDEAGVVSIMFALQGGKYRLQIPLPKIHEFPSKGAEPRGWTYWSTDRRTAWRRKEWEQACRSRWRTMILLVKSKLEIVRIGLSSAQREFMADMILANGQTVGELMASGGGQRLLAEVNEP